MVEFVVAIDEARVRFTDDALLFFCFPFIGLALVILISHFGTAWCCEYEIGVGNIVIDNWMSDVYSPRAPEVDTGNQRSGQSHI